MRLATSLFLLLATGCAGSSSNDSAPSKNQTALQPATDSQVAKARGAFKRRDKSDYNFAADCGTILVVMAIDSVRDKDPASDQLMQGAKVYGERAAYEGRKLDMTKNDVAEDMKVRLRVVQTGVGQLTQAAVKQADKCADQL